MEQLLKVTLAFGRWILKCCLWLLGIFVVLGIGLHFWGVPFIFWLVAVIAVLVIVGWMVGMVQFESDRRKANAYLARKFDEEDR